jgi:DNA invertase Pin-like site-specific DNA recombinase
MLEKKIQCNFIILMEHINDIYSRAVRTPAGKAMFQMMGVFAEFERAIIQERVRAGLVRARSEGKQLGRPRIAPELEERIRKALATPGRPGVRVIAKQFGIDPGTVQRISRPFEGASAVVV